MEKKVLLYKEMYHISWKMESDKYVNYSKLIYMFIHVPIKIPPLPKTIVSFSDTKNYSKHFQKTKERNLAKNILGLNNIERVAKKEFVLLDIKTLCKNLIWC